MEKENTVHSKKHLVPIHSLEENQALISKIMDMIAEHFGSSCEVLLHDFSKEYDHTIVDIRNGHVTGREVGGCATNLGLEILNGTKEPEDQYNYITYSPEGRMLRSSSVYFEDYEGRLIGSLCLNLDITDTVYLEKFLNSYNNCNQQKERVNNPNEFFSENVHNLLESLIDQASASYGKPPKLLSKEEKISFIEFLNSKGTFIISKSSERVCEILGISKYSFYSYLDGIRKKDGIDNKKGQN